MAHICVPIMVKSVSQAAALAARSAEAGADYVEYRLDELGAESASEITELMVRTPLPAIATCRGEAEGGLSDLDDDGRLSLLTAAVAGGARYIDFELASVNGNAAVARRLFQLAGLQAKVKADKGPRAGEPCKLILSAHDFFGRPNKLTSLVADMQSLPCDVAKVAWMARTVRDNLEAFELIRMSAKPLIALCMGEAGLMSRLLAGKAGAWLTFAALSAEGGSAPGQATIQEMLRLYRYREIKPSTRVFGVIGWPVGHSLSPAVHNAAMQGLPGVYLPLPVMAGYESLKATLEALSVDDHLHFAGASVTVPHKEDAMRYAEAANARVEPSAHALGTVNTLAWEGGHWRAANTDAAAIVDSLAAALSGGRAGLVGKRVAVIGAGGTGRTAAGALVGEGCSVTLYNRTFERGVAVAKDIAGVTAARWEALAHERHDVYVNCTTVGMYPHVEGNVLAGMDFVPPRGSVAMDCVYTPRETRFLKIFSDAGCKAISGLEMFLHQAARQFELWHRQPADLGVMRQVAEAELDRREAKHAL